MLNKKFISLNLVALIGLILITIFVVEILPFNFYKHLTLIELGNIFAIAYVFTLGLVLMFIVEFILNKVFNLKIIKTDILRKNWYNLLYNIGIVINSLFIIFYTYLLLFL